MNKLTIDDMITIQMCIESVEPMDLSGCEEESLIEQIYNDIENCDTLKFYDKKLILKEVISNVKDLYHTDEQAYHEALLKFAMKKYSGLYKNEK